MKLKRIKGRLTMTVIYIDVLIGLNIYITYFLLLATEVLSKSKSSSLRRGLAACGGGASSLLILAPDFSFILLLLIKLILAALLILINFGFQSRAVFFKRTLVFFGVNFIFAGCMIAVWFIFSPARLAIRNGVIYYHLSALTLIVSTVLAYGAVRLLDWVLKRRVHPKLLYEAEVTVDGQQTALTVFLDTGNKAVSISGLPAVLCNAKSLSGIVPAEILSCMQDIEAVSALSGQQWASRIHMIPYQAVGSKGILAGFKPDSFVIIKNGERCFCPCILAPVFEPLSDGEADAIAGEALFQE